MGARLLVEAFGSLLAKRCFERLDRDVWNMRRPAEGFFGALKWPVRK